MNNPIAKQEVEPDSPDFVALSCATYLNGKLNSFDKPAALICYWRQEKVRKRLQALPNKWHAELVRRYENRLATLNEQGG